MVSPKVQALLNKNPRHCPVIIQSKSLGINCKYLLPDDYRLATLVYRVRHDCKVEIYQGLYMIANNYMLVSSDRVVDVYARYRDDDGILYLWIEQEKVFG